MGQAASTGGDGGDGAAGSPPVWADAVTARAFASAASEFGGPGFERARKGWGGAALDASGKRCMVLGADTALGTALAEGLAACGATVHLTAPTLPAAEGLRDELMEATGSEEIHAHACDLRRFRSIRELASGFAIEFDSLDVLIHSAEQLPLEHRLGDDGVEAALALMLGGSFLLPALLLPHLAAEGGGQIIHVGSPELLMVDAPLIPLAALQQRPVGHFDGVLHHARLKALQQRLSVAWAARLHTAAGASGGGRVRSNGMHCGWHEGSPALRATPSLDGAPGGWVQQRRGRLRTCAQAADTALWLATQPEGADDAPSGQMFFDRCARPTELRPPKAAVEQAVASAGDHALWEWCEALCQCPCAPEKLLRAIPIRSERYKRPSASSIAASSRAM